VTDSISEAPAVRPVENVSVYQTELADVGELKPHPRNYKRHPREQLLHILESIRQHGVYRNVVVARDGTILAGHGVVEAARLGGISRLPVYRLPLDPASPAALKVLATDNELGKFADADDALLAGILREVLEQDPVGLLGTGFDDAAFAELARFVAEAPGGPEGEPAPQGGGSGYPAAGGARGGAAAAPPDEFLDLAAEGAVKTDHRCPRCSYEWSGAAK
jgi:hypothetical protein